MNGSNGQRLSRHDLMRRYGVSAQQINGWLARTEHPFRAVEGHQRATILDDFYYDFHPGALGGRSPRTRAPKVQEFTGCRRRRAALPLLSFAKVRIAANGNIRAPANWYKGPAVQSLLPCKKTSPFKLRSAQPQFSGDRGRDRDRRRHRRHLAHHDDREKYRQSSKRRWLGLPRTVRF